MAGRPVSQMSDEELLALVNLPAAPVRQTSSEPGAIGRVGQTLYNTGEGISGGAYRALQGVLERSGFSGAADWAGAQADIRQDTINRNPGVQTDWRERPIESAFGAVANAAGSLPWVMTPLGQAAMYSSFAGENIDAQRAEFDRQQRAREAEATARGEEFQRRAFDPNVTSAVAMAVPQALMERFSGVERLVGRGAGSIAHSAGRRAASVGARSAVEEAVAEGAQQFGTIAQADWNTARDRLQTSDTWGQIGSAALSGAIGGGAIGGAYAAMNPLAPTRGEFETAIERRMAGAPSVAPSVPVMGTTGPAPDATAMAAPGAPPGAPPAAPAAPYTPPPPPPPGGVPPVTPDNPLGITPPTPPTPPAPAGQTGPAAPPPLATGPVVTPDPMAPAAGPDPLNPFAALGNMAQGLGDKIRSGLWEGYSAGTGGMQNDNTVQAARAVSKQLGRQMSQAEFARFSEGFSKAAPGQERRAFIMAFLNPLAAPNMAAESARSPLDAEVASMTPEGGTPTPAAVSPGVPAAGAPGAVAAEAGAVPGVTPGTVLPGSIPAEGAPSPIDPATGQPVAEDTGQSAPYSEEDAEPYVPQTKEERRAVAQQAKQDLRDRKVIDAYIGQIAGQGSQGALAAQELRDTINQGLEDGTFNAEQVKTAAEQARIISDILPTQAGYLPQFVGELFSRTGDKGPIQGRVDPREHRAFEGEARAAMQQRGLAGLVSFALDPSSREIATETAAHEGYHIIRQWLKANDPATHEALDRAFPIREDGYAHIEDIDPSIRKILERYRKPGEAFAGYANYFDYINDKDYGLGPGVHKNSEEAQATIFGALYDLKKHGKQISGMPGIIQRFFARLAQILDRFRNTKSAKGLMEGVISGRFREQAGNLPIARPAATDEDDDDIRQGPAVSPQGADTATARPEREAARVPPDAAGYRLYRRTLAVREGADGQAWTGPSRSGGVEQDGVVHSLTPEAKQAFEAVGITPIDLVELPKGEASATRFSQAIQAAKDSTRFGAAVHVYPTEDYQDLRLFLSEDGMAGFALKPAGEGIVDIVSAFNHNDSTSNGAAHAMLSLATQLGGNKLDAFDTVLPRIYAEAGFRVASRMAWNDQYQPDGWDKATFAKFNNGEPDVVFMAHTGRYTPYGGHTEGILVDDYDKAVEIQEAMVRDPSDADMESKRLDARYGYNEVKGKEQKTYRVNPIGGLDVTGQLGVSVTDPNQKPVLNTQIIRQARIMPHGERNSDVARILVDKDGKGYLIAGQGQVNSKTHMPVEVTYFDGGNKVAASIFHPTRLELAAMNERTEGLERVTEYANRLAQAGVSFGLNNRQLQRLIKSSSIPLLLGIEAPKAPVKDFDNNAGVAVMLQERTRKAMGGMEHIEERKRNDLGQSEATRGDKVGQAIFDRMTQTMTLEFFANLDQQQRQGGALNQGADWYDRSIKRAIGVLSIKHPELLDPNHPDAALFGSPENARSAFMTALAITSQGEKVMVQTGQANDIYTQLKKDIRSKGEIRFDTTKIGGAQSAKAIRENFEKFNKLMEDMPGETQQEKMSFVRRFLNTEFDPQILSRAFPDVLSGDLITAPSVHGSAIFGPKIGDGFYQNLMGNFDPLTVDLWFTRTFNRIYGHLIGNKKALPGQIAKMQQAYAEGRAIADLNESEEGRQVNAADLRQLQVDVDLVTTELNTLLAIDRKSLPKEERGGHDERIRQVKAQRRTLRSRMSNYKHQPDPGLDIRSDMDFLTAGKLGRELETEWMKIYDTDRIPFVVNLLSEAREATKDAPGWRKFTEAEARELATTNTPKKLKDDARAARTAAFAIYANEHQEGGSLESAKPFWAYAAKAMFSGQGSAFGQPANVSERRAMGKMVDAAVAMINKALGKQKGEPGAVTRASFQAVMWYPEKELWARLQQANAEIESRGEGYDDANPVETLMGIPMADVEKRSATSYVENLNQNYEAGARVVVGPENQSLANAAAEATQNLEFTRETLTDAEVKEHVKLKTKEAKYAKSEAETEAGKEAAAEAEVPNGDASSFVANQSDTPDALTQVEQESARVTDDYFKLATNKELQSVNIPKSVRGAVRGQFAINSMPEEIVQAGVMAEVRLIDRLSQGDGSYDAADLVKVVTDEYKGTGYEAYAREIHRVLQTAAAKGMKVYTSDFKGTIEYADGTPESGPLDRGIGSYFNPNGPGGYVYLNTKATTSDGSSHSTLLHEYVHAATHKRIEQIYRGLGDDAALREALETLRLAVRAHLDRHDLLLSSIDPSRVLSKYYTDGPPGYTNATKGIHELIAESLSSPYMQRILATAPITDDVRQAFKDAGIEIADNSSLFRSFIAAMKKVLGINPKNTLFDALMAVSPRTLNVPVSPAEVSRLDELEMESSRLDPTVGKFLKRVVHDPGRAGYIGRAISSQPFKAANRRRNSQKFRAGAVDRYAALEDDERNSTGNTRLAAELSGFTAMWQADDADAYVRRMWETGGSLELVQDKKNARNSYWHVNEKVTKGGMKWLTDYLAQGEGKQDAIDRMKAFQAYAIVKRGNRLNADGIPNQVSVRDKKVAAAALRQYPELAKAYAGYQEMNRSLMDTMVKAGLLTPEDAKFFVQHNDYYPFYRTVAETDPLGNKRISGIGSKFKPLEIIGGVDPFNNDPLEVIMNNVSYWSHAAMRNVARQKVIHTGLKTGSLRKPTASDAAAGRIHVRVNGLDYSFVAEDPGLLAALEAKWSMPPEWHSTFRFLGAPARLLREMVTKNPVFMLYTNLVRDSQAAWLTSGANFVPLAGTAKGFVDFYRKDPDTMRYLSLGHGQQAKYHDTAFRSAADLLRDDIRLEKGIYQVEGPGMLLDILKKAYHQLDRASQASDVATRSAIFKAALAEGHSEVEAAWRAREVMNFSKRGTSTLLQGLSAMVPFTNARIQGLDTTIQALTGNRVGDVTKTKQQRMGTAMVRGAILAGIALMLEHMFGDDDEVKDQPRWMRDTNLIVPMKHLGFPDLGILTIPKPFEFGTLFMTIPAHAYRAIAGREPGSRTPGEIATSIAASLQYNPIPTAALVPIEQIANYSFFTGRPIVGRSLENLSPELQFTRGTPGAFREAGDVVARAFLAMGMNPPAWAASPARMEHVTRALTGTLGVNFAATVGALAGAEDNSSRTWRDVPIIGSVFRDPTKGQPAGIERMYDLIRSSDEVTRTLRHYRSVGDSNRVREITEANRGLIDIRSSLNQMKTQHQRLTQQQRQIMRDPRIPAADKQTRLAAIDATIRTNARNVEALERRAGR